MKLFISLVFLILLTACAEIETKTTDDGMDELVAAHNEVADAEDRIICTRKKQIGSNLTTKSCRTVRQIKQERQMSVDNMRREIDRMNRKTTPSSGN